jgi:large subunit ribosomal protein L30
MFAILRVRGPTKVNVDIEYTMKLLRLTRVNHCVIYPEDKKIKGMLFKIRNMVTYGEITKEVLKKMLLKRGFVYDEKGKLLKFKTKYTDEKQLDKLVEEIISGKVKINDINLKPVFRLKPPTKGYDRKGIKKTFKEGGVLGYRADHMDKLLLKMI